MRSYFYAAWPNLYFSLAAVAAVATEPTNRQQQGCPTVSWQRSQPMLLPGSPNLLFNFTYCWYSLQMWGRVPPNTFHRAARWTHMVYGVSPVVVRVVRTLQDMNPVCIHILFNLLLSVCVIARPNVKRHTFGSLLRSLKFGISHVVHWTFVLYQWFGKKCSLLFL